MKTCDEVKGTFVAPPARNVLLSTRGHFCDVGFVGNMFLGFVERVTHFVDQMLLIGVEYFVCC